MNLITWWEQELTNDERTNLMKEYSWHGTIEERHTKLREMYNEWMRGKNE